MKFIVAIIRPDRLTSVQEALDSIGIHGITVSDVKGYGKQKGQKEIFRGMEYEVKFVQKVKLEIAVNANEWERVVETIVEKARSGKIGDGKIFVYDLTETVRIRTGEKGSLAL